MDRVDFNTEGRRYPVIFIQDKPFLFSDIRIKRSTAPDGLFMYDIAEESCGSGKIAKVSTVVLCNYFGTIIGKHELDLGVNEIYYPEIDSDEWAGIWLDKTLTFDEYIHGQYITNEFVDLRAFAITS